VSATLTAANCSTLRFITFTPAKTTNAETRSPPRTKNVSIACFALYLSSRLVGSQRSWRAVFISE